MPHKRPSDLRRSARHRPRWHNTPHIRGLPAWAQQEVFEIELITARDWARFGLWAGAVAEALAGWTRTSRNPAALEAHPCGCCGRRSRQLLQQAIDLLSAPSACALTQLVQALDEDFLQRSLPDPSAPDDWPWWERRCEYRH
jgi:hypothetical protein